MPNRIIRESCRTSPNLALLSHGAERFFWRLITVADDYGRFEAEQDVLLCACFPKLLDRVKLTHIKEWFAELVTCQLVTTYVVSTRTYAFFNTWQHHQRTRAQHSKYPSPSSDNICQHVLSNVADLRPTTYDLRPTINGKEPLSDSSPKSDIATSQANELLNHLNLKTGHSYRAVAPNLNLIRDRLKIHTPEEIRSVIDAKVDEWRHDPKMKKFLRPATLFQSGKFEQYLGQVGSREDNFFPFPTDDGGE